MIGSASKIGCWRRCQKKAYFQYVLDIERVIQSIAPSKGSTVHACLEANYSGKDWTKPINDLVIDMSTVFDEERQMWIELPDELYRIVQGYLATYRLADKEREVLAVEKHFTMPLANGRHTYEGYIDKIDRDNYGIWATDYKTAGQIPNVVDLFMDVQTCMYALGISRGHVDLPIKKGEKVGIMFDHIRTKPPRVPALLKNGTISRAECVTDVNTYMSAVKANGLRPEDYADMVPKLQKHVFYRRAAIPTRKSTIKMIEEEVVATMDDMEIRLAGANTAERPIRSSMFPRTFIQSRCSWDCGYFKLCIGELCGMDTEGIIASDYQKRKGRDKADGEIDE